MLKLFKNPLFIVVFTIFLDSLGFAILFPIMPELLADPSSEFYMLPKGVSVESGYLLLGFILALFPLMQFFSTSILGQLSDSIGQEKNSFLHLNRHRCLLCFICFRNNFKINPDSFYLKSHSRNH